jgi:mannose-6-phosphate isomerase
MPDTFYRGAGRIGRLRGDPAVPAERPEDWLASTTARFGRGTNGRGTDGMTRLADGTLLADLIAGDPVGWLGREHVARYGPDPALLVKLLDAGQRLPLHVHPDRGFAAEHLASPYGKTEAWIVLEAAPDAAVHLGFSRDVTAAELAGWVDGQDVSSMLAATNRVPVTAGDTLLCPAGTPHAIGEGILLVELQEPSDWSVILEWRDFPLGPDEVTPGLPLAEALACVGRRACPPALLRSLRGRPFSAGIGSLLPGPADPFFIAERVDGGTVLAAGYGVLIVTDGTGTLDSQTAPPVSLRPGSTVLIPHAAGPCTLTGDFRAIRCRPALPVSGWLEHALASPATWRSGRVRPRPLSPFTLPFHHFPWHILGQKPFLLTSTGERAS